MCGILAYYNRTGITGEKLNQSLSALKKINHRGPDGEGVTLINSITGEFRNLITDETPAGNFKNTISLNEAQNFQFDLLFGHRRLSIIDLTANGHQPMSDESGNWIVFNGEVYNYLELREELKATGCTFKTESDTEVILAAYRVWGADCVKKFNGMFAIVLFDSEQQQLFVANDRFGVKPLYQYKDEHALIYVSELKQLKEYKLNLSTNSNAVNVFLQEHYINYNCETFYKEVSRHKPSSYAKVSLKNRIEISETAYYDVSLNNNLNCTLNEAKEKFRELLLSAIRLRMRSDVPVGFSSSGGLDSSAILYLSHKILSDLNVGSNVNTFSAIFPGEEGDESYFIKLVEKDLNIKSYYVNPVEEFSIEDFEKHIYHQDEPVLTTAFYAGWSVARLARKQNVTVLMVGQGADEILAGYHHHFYRYSRQLILGGHILKYLSELKKYAEIKGIDSNKLHRLILNDVKLAFKFKLGIAKTGGVLSDKWNKANKLIELLKTDLTETNIPFYLRADDRNSMAFHIESRHPFLDYRLVDFCYSLPDSMKINDGWQKYLLRESIDTMHPEIRYRKDKKGYTTPQNKWLNLYKSDFEKYLKFIPETYNLSNVKDPFLKYALGAWFKVNN
ncbi:MAG: asparagine synthase (glutamine-hydrolyzing) [Bacteroidia bacterium]|nr:asparagine synthase (glutamine-hydrolyzing) [Bacteroidia bacterium]